MPSFYPANAHAQMPLAPSDYAMRYGHGGYGVHQDQLAFTAYQQAGHHELGPLLPDPYELYKSAPARSTAMYHQPNRYVNAAPNGQRQMGAPAMPPLRVDDRRVGDRADTARVAHRGGYRTQPQHSKEEKSVGGVSAKLDYEMERMTDFVAEMTVGMYELYMSRICIDDIDLVRSVKPSLSLPPTFRKWVLQVLNATRLPSATILLGLSYLSLRVRGLSSAGRFTPNERTLYQMLTVALILGSKFLDDNTFQNKSWAEVSNISVAELNKDEREWLTAFGHRLHHDPRAADGYKTWEDQWNRYNSRSSSSSSVLHQVDTNLHRQRPARQHLSAAEYQGYTKSVKSSLGTENDGTGHHYHTPTYSPYDPWHNQRSAVDRSPSTAPHTGPTTPDYYGAQGAWGPLEPCSTRQGPYSYATVPHFTPQVGPHQSVYYHSQYGHAAQTAWNCHGAACQCQSCRQLQMFQPRYGPIVVG